MGIEVTCDECCKSTDDVVCYSCAQKLAPHEDLDEFALHDLARSIALGDRDEAFLALDVLIRDLPGVVAMRERIAIARSTI